MQSYNKKYFDSKIIEEWNSVCVDSFYILFDFCRTIFTGSFVVCIYSHSFDSDIIKFRWRY